MPNSEFIGSKIIRSWFNWIERAMGETRKVIKNTAFSAISLIMRLVTNAILMLFIARRLGVDRFGQFAFAIAFAQFFSMFADFGLDTLVIKEVAQNRHNISRFADNILSLKAILSAVVIILSVIIINLLKYSMNVKLLVYVAVLSTLAFEFIVYILALFRSVERMRDESIISLIYNLILIASISPVLFLIGSPIYVMLTYLIVRACVSLWAKRFFSKTVYPIKFSYDLFFWKRLLVEAIPYGLFGFAALIYFQSDAILLSYFKGDKPVGLYQAAISIVVAIMYFSEMLFNAFLPVLSRYFSTSKETFLRGIQNFLYILLFIAIPATVFTFISAQKIIILLYGEQFASAGVVLKWTSFLIFLRFAACAYGIILTVSSNQGTRTRAAISTAILNIVLNLFLIPKFGISGAIFSTLIAHVILNIQYMEGAYRVTRSFLIDKDILTLFIVALILGAISYYFSNFNLITLFCFYSILYLVILYIIPNSKLKRLLNKVKERQL